MQREVLCLNMVIKVSLINPYFTNMEYQVKRQSLFESRFEV